MENKKTTEHAASVIKAMQEEYAKGVIKDWEMPPLVNMKTGETTGVRLRQPTRRGGSDCIVVLTNKNFTN